MVDGMWTGLREVGMGASLCFFVAVQACVLLLFRWNLRHGVEARRWSGVVLAAVYGVAALLTWRVMGGAAGMWPALGGSVLIAMALCVAMRHDSVVRSLYFTNQVLGALLGTVILYRWFQEGFPPSASVARMLLFIPWVASLGGLVLLFVYRNNQDTAALQPLMRRRHLRPTQPLPPRRAPPFPRVTVQVPCYAEPPDVVKATLEAIARLDYPNFDVLVVDSNTKDPALWRPVEAHCAKLGARFRFIHVESLPGAKGGALNLAMRHTPPETQVVALLDADFVCEPDFLSRLVGFFDDPAIDYVQTPHDYRGWEGRRFLRSAYWAERLGNDLHFPGRNEWNLGVLIGTLCLIRREALDAAGGWSETCLSEDTELALRLSARGGQGLCLRSTFGRGLLPETFPAYQKQRFRWTVGPIQQLRLHWRAMVTGRHPRMVPEQRWDEVFRGLSFLNEQVLLLLGVLGLLGLSRLAFDRQSIALPDGLLVLMGTGFASAGVRSWLRSQLLGCSLGDLCAAEVIKAARAHTERVAVRVALFSRSPPVFRRTSKFKASPVGWRDALASTRPELTWGVLALGLAGALFLLSDLSHPDLFLLGAVGLGWRALGYFCAPAMAVLADAELREQTKAALNPEPAPERPAAAAPATVAACRTGAESSPGASPPR
ncbi:MAG: glycosyltransferase [Myxococcaceae bacterium]|nr:MAG: glycosyltransferase [Myxococcaceae bacterium]